MASRVTTLSNRAKNLLLGGYHKGSARENTFFFHESNTKPVNFTFDRRATFCTALWYQLWAL